MHNETNADQREMWSENLPEFGPDTQLYHGQASRDALADLLDGKPARDESDVTRRLRGRPGLNIQAPKGTRSKQLHVRIGDDLADLLDQHLASSPLKDQSELVRVALNEYFENHRLSA